MTADIPIACTLSGPELRERESLIQLERRCCPFLRFTLTVEPAEGAVELALTGAAGVREFLSTWLAPGTGVATSAV